MVNTKMIGSGFRLARRSLWLCGVSLVNGERDVAKARAKQVVTCLRVILKGFAGVESSGAAHASK